MGPPAPTRRAVVTREVGAMDNATYRGLDKIDTLTTSPALRRLRDAGLFEQNGRGSVITNRRLGCWRGALAR